MGNGKKKENKKKKSEQKRRVRDPKREINDLWTPNKFQCSL
jgi:hypothetical protein